MTLSFLFCRLDAQPGTLFLAMLCVTKIEIESRSRHMDMDIDDDEHDDDDTHTLQWPEGTLDALLTPRADSLPQSCPAVSSDDESLSLCVCVRVRCAF